MHRANTGRYHRCRSSATTPPLTLVMKADSDPARRCSSFSGLRCPRCFVSHYVSACKSFVFVFPTSSYGCGFFRPGPLSTWARPRSILHSLSHSITCCPSSTVSFLVCPLQVFLLDRRRTCVVLDSPPPPSAVTPPYSWTICIHIPNLAPPRTHAHSFGYHSPPILDPGGTEHGNFLDRKSVV